jgi:hypothetical protein
MKTTIVFYLVATSFILYACRGKAGANHEPETGKPELADNASTGPPHSDAKTCCMQSEEDFYPFLPETAGDFKTKGHAYANLFCLDDPETASNATISYYDNEGKRYSVMIKDYCAFDFNEKKYLADPEYDKSVRNEPGDLKILNEDAIWGYAKYYKQNPGINNSNPAYVKVFIDQRFYMQIQSLEQTGITEVMALFEALPVQKLMAYKK